MNPHFDIFIVIRILHSFPIETMHEAVRWDEVLPALVFPVLPLYYIFLPSLPPGWSVGAWLMVIVALFHGDFAIVQSLCTVAL